MKNAHWGKMLRLKALEEALANAVGSQRSRTRDLARRACHPLHRTSELCCTDPEGELILES